MSSTIESKNFRQPDEVRSLPKVNSQLVSLNGQVVMKGKYEPGWKWSESMKPSVGTDSCQIHHLVYVESGKMTVKMNDGKEITLGPGDAADIPPGHDAWVVGDEPCVLVDFKGAANYGKKL